jgi:pyruvate dehydrogenase E1 component alpha subunit
VSDSGRRLTDEEALRVYAVMATARAVEQRLAEAYADGQLPGWIHSCEGQEAFGGAVAVCLDERDHLVPHYRSRPEQLGKGMSVRAVLAEVFATVHAASGGRGGETHVSSAEHRIYGMTGVLGANIPLGAGVAYASKLRGTDEVTLCTFGDGTANRGAFHEALNLAAIWELPVVFVCENNAYAEMSPITDFLRVPDIAARAAGYGMPGVVVDGHDPEAVIDALRAAVDAARAGTPSLLEAKMIRRRGHWEGDQQAYRSEDELRRLDEVDPVRVYRSRLIRDRGLEEPRLAALEDGARREVEEALAWAASSPRPGVREVTTGVYEHDG